MKKQVMKLLETYPERERQIALLHYEMQHSVHISPEMDRMNAEAANEIAQRLLELEGEQNWLRYYVSLLEKCEAEALRLFYFKGRSWEETAKELGVVLRSVYKIKSKATDHLANLYAYKAGLN